LTSRDSFCAPEIDIFKAIQSWAERYNDLNSTGGSGGVGAVKEGVSAGGSPTPTTDAVMATVRFPLISLNDLLVTVRGSSLVSSDAILDAIKVTI